jgi:hypothetical protein
VPSVMESGSLNPWNPLGHTGPVMGLLYLLQRFSALSFAVKEGYIWNVTVACGSGVKYLDLRESAGCMWRGASHDEALRQGTHYPHVT